MASADSTQAAPMVAPIASSSGVGADVEAGVEKKDVAEEESSNSEGDSDSSDSSDEERLGKFGPQDRLWWRTRRARFGCGVCGLSLVLFIFLFWPRMPVWGLQKVDFDDSMISKMASAFYDPKFNDSFVFPLNASVKVWNPNFVAGAWVGEGHFNVTYEGVRLGTALSLPMYSPHHAECISHAITHNKLTPEVDALLRSQLTPDFRLKNRPVVVGEVPVKVWGFIPLTVHLNCSVEVHLLDIVASPPGIVVYDHDCVYRLR